MRKMTQAEETKIWLQLNVKKLIEANKILGDIRLYQFDTEDKDAFIDAAKTLTMLVEKYDTTPKDVSKYKVYGVGHYYHEGKTYRAVVAAKSKKRAAERFKVSMYTFNNYAAVTKNKAEVEAAMAQPETVIIRGKGF